MYLREILNKNRSIVVSLLVILTAAAVGWCAYQLHSFSPGKPPTKGFYTVDDGKTWFADDLTNVPPFDHNGQQAVRARVFYCDSDNKPFVAWMERFTPKMKARLEQEIKDRAEKLAQGQSPGPPFDPEPGMEVKKPGTGQWVKVVGHDDIRVAACPDGSQVGLHPMTP